MSTNTILDKARLFCEETGNRLTEPRIRVLEIIANSPKAIGAYDVLEKLGRYLDNPKPPTAYRSIDFWIEHGFVHKIESLNAYTVCRESHHHNGSQFLICDTCGDVQETHLCHVPQTLRDKAEGKQFSISNWNVELHGQCRDCNDNGA